MAIEYVGGILATAVGSTSTSVSIPLTSGLTGGIASSVSDGDLVIAAFATGAKANRTLSITDGSSNYTLIGSELHVDDVYDTNLRVAYKFVSGDDEVEFGPTGNASDAGVMAVYVFRGVDSTTPLDVAATSATDTNTFDINPPAITPVTAGAYIVAVGAHAGSNNTVTSFPGLVETFTASANDANPVGFGIGQKQDWTSGSFNPSAWSISGSDSNDHSWAAMTIALRPVTSITAYDIVPDAGSYAFTGTDASPEHHREVVADAGSYTWTGATASLERGFAIDADAGAYAFTGFSAALSTQAQRVLVLEPGSYAFTGASASLERGFEVAAAAGSYGFTGAAAALAYSGIRRRAANFYFG